MVRTRLPSGECLQHCCCCCCCWCKCALCFYACCGELGCAVPWWNRKLQADRAACWRSFTGVQWCYSTSMSFFAYDLGCLRHGCCWCCFLRFCLLLCGVCYRTWLGDVAVSEVICFSGAGSISKANWSFARQLHTAANGSRKAEVFARLMLLTAAW